MRACDESWPFVPEIRLFHSREKCARHLGRDVDEMTRDGAQTWYRDGVAVVLIDYAGKRRAEDALLVHEAHHVMRAHYDWLGEENPSEEFCAYGTQIAAHALMKAHDRWRRRRHHDA